ncbi:MAG: hypothetical protein KC417_14370, partial [Myxococcales bacterium]|nr:hypothetical protein [Myxococcales bacterium]
PACGRVLADGEPCPHCHAVAGVFASGDGLLCAACGKRRDAHPARVIVGRTSLAPSSAKRGAVSALQAIGYSVFAVSSVMALWLFVRGAPAYVYGSLPVVAAMAWRLASRGKASSKALESERDAAIERDVRAVAIAHGGRLTAVELADAIHLETEAADALLVQIAGRNSAVTVEVTHEGKLEFLFLDALSTGTDAPRVRVLDATNMEAEAGTSDASDAPGHRADKHRD